MTATQILNRLQTQLGRDFNRFAAAAARRAGRNLNLADAADLALIELEQYR